MVRQEDAVLVLFRMREVVLRSSLSGNTLMMQPSSTWFRASLEQVRQKPQPVDGLGGFWVIPDRESVADDLRLALLKGAIQI